MQILGREREEPEVGAEGVEFIVEEHDGTPVSLLGDEFLDDGQVDAREVHRAENVRLEALGLVLLLSSAQPLTAQHVAEETVHVLRLSAVEGVEGAPVRELEGVGEHLLGASILRAVRNEHLAGLAGLLVDFAKDGEGVLDVEVDVHVGGSLVAGVLAGHGGELHLHEIEAVRQAVGDGLVDVVADVLVRVRRVLDGYRRDLRCSYNR